MKRTVQFVVCIVAGDAVDGVQIERGDWVDSKREKCV